MRAKLLYLSSLCILSSCSTLHNVRVCSVAGRLQAGMDCAWTGSPKAEEMTANDSLKFLEGGALCMSPDDYRKMHTDALQACYLLGPACSIETVTAISQVDQKMTALMSASKVKAKLSKP